MSGGSRQLRLFRRAMRDGASIEQAAEAGGMSIEEARLHAARDEKSPPPPEAYELLGKHSPKAEERTFTMADDDERTSTEVESKDFERVKRLYRNDIKPAKSEAASQQQAIGEAYKLIKKECHVQPQAAKMAIKLVEMEEAHMEDCLRCLVGTLNELLGWEALTYNSNDLVDRAETLVTLGGDDFEAGDEELASQSARPSTERRKAQAEQA